MLYQNDPEQNNIKTGLFPIVVKFLIICVANYICDENKNEIQVNYAWINWLLFTEYKFDLKHWYTLKINKID